MNEPSKVRTTAIKAALKSAVFTPLIDKIRHSDLEDIAALGITPATLSNRETVVATLRGVYDNQSVFDVVTDYVGPPRLGASAADSGVKVSIIEKDDKVFVIMPATVATELQSKLLKGIIYLTHTVTMGSISL